MSCKAQPGNVAKVRGREKNVSKYIICPAHKPPKTN